MRDPVQLCAESYAGWHTSWLTALGVPSQRDAGIWRALEPPPLIYLAGITLDPDVSAEQIADAPGSVGDVWQTLELDRFDFRVSRTARRHSSRSFACARLPRSWSSSR